MGLQTSKHSNSIYFHQKLPSFRFTKKQNTQKPEEPIKFQYQKSVKKQKQFDTIGIRTINNLKSVLDDVKSECISLKNCSINDSRPISKDSIINQSEILDTTNKSQIIRRRTKDEKKGIKTKKLPVRTKSEPNLRAERKKDRTKYNRKNGGRLVQKFGYEIQDVDGFLEKATLNKPANIPVVLALPSVLYQTRVGGYQAEISLPLGMVVNAIFKNQNWLYVQTPHAEEGYISYTACLPLGIIPPPQDDKSSPCWEKSTDVFPKPSGNMTDTEKPSYKSENNEETYCPRTRYRTAYSTCGEKSVDRLYLRAAAIAKGKGTRHTLLVINENYKGNEREYLSVAKNDVVFLLNASTKGWFYVQNKEGRKGFIPAVVAGHGFL